MKQDIKQVVSTLQQGGVVVLPTDTVYGLAVVPTDATAVKKIYTLKERPMSMFLPIMVAHIGQLEELGVDINEPARKLLKSSLVPGGITFVLGFRPEAKKPEWLATRDEIAVRIPDNAFLLEVLEQT
ncbi:MAG: Sua5/YciO/YrdC/YwlC family protein [Candidatus Peribacteria bacterium]|jgi:L-threonylcarbamoyladenylate synthase|nr:Sua5/YciO/YrdC/YwlC family protein [Candidatus Peribacteria bacterium]